jgi:sugar/nucleoside kinase (ribokinase family)
MLSAVVGDCLLDVMVRPHGPMRAGGDTPAQIRIGPGGQGANVAVRLARRGASVRLISPMADDLGARLLREALDRDAVNLATLAASKTGSVIAMLDRDGERTMASDRVSLAAAALPELVEDADWIHVSGYALRDASGEQVARTLAARRRVARLSVGGGSVPPDRAAAQAFTALVELARPDLLLLARSEAAALLEVDDAVAPEQLASSLAARRPSTIVIVTAGADGSVGASAGLSAPVAVPGLDSSTPIVDATGAGDAYAAALIDELAHLGTWPPSGDQLRTAMRAASHLGGLVARVEGAQGRVEGEAAPRTADEVEPLS